MASDERTELEAMIKSIAVSSPHQLTVEQLNKDFRSEIGFSIPFRKMGYSNLEAFLRSLNRSIELIGYGPCAMVRTITNEKSKHIHDMVRNQKKPRKQNKNSKNCRKRNYNYTRYESIPNKTKLESPRSSINSSSNSGNNNIQSYKPFLKNLLANVESYNTRIENKKDQQNYIKFHRSSIKPDRNKEPLSDIQNLEISIESSLKITNEKKTEKLINIDEEACGSATLPKLVDKCKDINLNLNKSSQTVTTADINCNNIDEAIPKYAIDKRVILVDFMERNITFGHSIPHYMLPRDMKRLDVVGIYITEVHNPFKFWFHLHKENHELDTLMSNMETFYESLLSDMFTMPISAIIPGEVCATLYNNIWHRARIISYVTNYTAKVFFVDYGTVSEVDVRYIKYLSANFAEIPSQAIRGSLSHLKPRGLHWSHEATKYFVDKVQELLLYAQVSEVDKIDRVVYMVVCDTNSSNVTQINKLLIHQGFAMVDPHWFPDQMSQKRENSERYRHLRENFPTFSMIENGEYPSFLELVDLLNIGIDYERITDSNLFHPGVLSIPTCTNSLPFQLLNTNPFRFEILIAAVNS